MGRSSRVSRTCGAQGGLFGTEWHSGDTRRAGDALSASLLTASAALGRRAPKSHGPFPACGPASDSSTGWRKCRLHQCTSIVPRWS